MVHVAVGTLAVAKRSCARASDAFEPGPGHYTWWSQRRGVREKNVGWRIDYVLASPAAMRYVRAAFIQPQVTGSDHFPGRRRPGAGGSRLTGGRFCISH